MEVDERGTSCMEEGFVCLSNQCELYLENTGCINFFYKGNNTIRL